MLPSVAAVGRPRRLTRSPEDVALLTIRGIQARPVLVPFRIPPVSASGAMPRAALVLIDLETEQGVTGRSYVFAFAPWALAPIVGSVQGLLALVKGDAVAPLDLHAKLRRQLTLLDTPGLVGIALAGIDMAAWDALAQSQGVPLARLHLAVLCFAAGKSMCIMGAVTAS